MKSFALSIATAFTLFTATSVIADTVANFTGTWINQRGSTLILEAADGNNLNGTFNTAVANTQSCIGKAVPLQGVHNGNAAAFSLSMESCGSPVTIALSSTLQVDENHQETLHTMDLVQWQGQESWKSKVIGTDTFVRAVK